jgi:aryl-alcohol dehydrogenase-like predicted oxidoreductase
MTMPSVAIRFALDTPGVDVVLVGVSTVEELDAALDAWRRAPLTAAQRSLLMDLDRSALDVVHPERWAVAGG